MKKTIVLLLGALLASSMAMMAQAQLSVGGQNVIGADVDLNLPPAKSRPKLMVSGPQRMLLYIWALKGPVRENTNAFNAWSAQMVADIYQNGFPTNTAYMLSNRVTAADVTQPSGAGNATNNTLWFAFRAISMSGNDISPERFHFWGKSSDNPNYLNTATSLSDSNIVFSVRLLGVMGDFPGFPRSGDGVLVSGRISEANVRELIFIGAQGAYFTSPESAVAQFIANHPNWRDTGFWGYMDGGSTNSYAVKSLDSNLANSIMTNSWPALNLSVSPTNRSMAVIKVNADTENSVVVLQRKEVAGSGWNVFATGNARDTWTGSMTNHEFFKIRSQ